MATYDISIETLTKSFTKKPVSKTKPKYRHPTTNETWSGRGKMPLWLKSEITANRKQKEDFLIP
ncbi:MAG: H-NS histone family protein [Rhodocyclales bacterium]|nr:H-NS histone family protein [Rhodocyclales bacterium]